MDLTQSKEKYWVKLKRKRFDYESFLYRKRNYYSDGSDEPSSSSGSSDSDSDSDTSGSGSVSCDSESESENESEINNESYSESNSESEYEYENEKLARSTGRNDSEHKSNSLNHEQTTTIDQRQTVSHRSPNTSSVSPNFHGNTNNNVNKEKENAFCRTPTATEAKDKRYTWHIRFNELVEFYKKNGHCIVPSTFEKLGPWTKNQRHEYKLYQENKTSILTAERIEALNSMNFVWSVKPRSSWESRFEELKRFHKKHGHTKVPNRMIKLRRWVTNQRSQYNQLKSNKRSSMNEERIKALEEIGFVWSPLKQRAKEIQSNKEESEYDSKEESTDDEGDNNGSESDDSINNKRPIAQKKRKRRSGNTWDIRYNELLKFYNKNGHCRVKRRDGSLGNWVRDQRLNYKLFKENKKSYLTPERIETLNKINFVWRVKPENAWEIKYKALIRFHKKYGHFYVPDQFYSLKRWVRGQRHHYRKMKENKHSSMTAERVKALNAIGFEWNPKPMPVELSVSFRQLLNADDQSELKMFNSSGDSQSSDGSDDSSKDDDSPKKSNVASCGTSSTKPTTDEDALTDEMKRRREYVYQMFSSSGSENEDMSSVDNNTRIHGANKKCKNSDSTTLASEALDPKTLTEV